MLVLSRKEGEWITIRDTNTDEIVVEIQVCRESPSKLTVGLIASDRYDIYRTELGPKPARVFVDPLAAFLKKPPSPQQPQG